MNPKDNPSTPVSRFVLIGFGLVLVIAVVGSLLLTRHSRNSTSGNQYSFNSSSELANTSPPATSSPISANSTNTSNSSSTMNSTSAESDLSADSTSGEQANSSTSSSDVGNTFKNNYVDSGDEEEYEESGDPDRDATGRSLYAKEQACKDWRRRYNYAAQEGYQAAVSGSTQEIYYWNNEIQKLNVEIRRYQYCGSPNTSDGHYDSAACERAREDYRKCKEDRSRMSPSTRIGMDCERFLELCP